MNRDFLQYLAFYQLLVFAARVVSAWIIIWVWRDVPEYFQLGLVAVVAFNYSYSVKLSRLQQMVVPSLFLGYS